MTCLEAQEQFSALADETLSRGERAALDAHLVGCADCHRELERFRATVSLLRAIEPAQASLGFVDRVLAVTRPTPWYRRLLRRAFLPLPMKIPLEAAAIVLVGIGVAYVFQQTPELREVARMDAPASSQVEPRPSAPEQAKLSKRAAAESQIPTSREAPPAAPEGFLAPEAPLVARGTSPPAPEVPSPAPEAPPLRRETSPPAREAPSATREAPSATPEKLLADAARAQTGRAATGELSPPTSKAGAPASRDALESQQLAAPSAPPLARQRVDTPAEEKDAARAKNEPSATEAPPAAMAPPVTQPSLQAAPKKEARVAAKASAAADVSGRLSVADRGDAERALEDLVRRNGGALVQRRAVPDATVVEVVVPRATYHEFARQLATIGRWAPDGEPSELPAEVRLSLRLIDY